MLFINIKKIKLCTKFIFWDYDLKILKTVNKNIVNNYIYSIHAP